VALCHRIQRRVVQLLAITSRAKQQPAAAHVAAADEGRRKAETRPDDSQKRVHVLRRRDAAEQDDAPVVVE
jgi:hypothetical protein